MNLINIRVWVSYSHFILFTFILTGNIPFEIQKNLLFKGVLI